MLDYIQEKAAKNKRHKYFREQRYKQKLENDYDNHRRVFYGNPIVFITKEKDTKDHWHYIFDSPKRGRHYYVYYERPEVPYTILEHRKSRDNAKKYFKKWSNKCIRKAKNLHHCGSNHKKVFDLWYTLF